MHVGSMGQAHHMSGSKNVQMPQKGKSSGKAASPSPVSSGAKVPKGLSVAGKGENIDVST